MDAFIIILAFLSLMIIPLILEKYILSNNSKYLIGLSILLFVISMGMMIHSMHIDNSFIGISTSEGAAMLLCFIMAPMIPWAIHIIKGNKSNRRMIYYVTMEIAMFVFALGYIL